MLLALEEQRENYVVNHMGDFFWKNILVWCNEKSIVFFE